MLFPVVVGKPKSRSGYAFSFFSVMMLVKAAVELGDELSSRNNATVVV